MEGTWAISGTRRTGSTSSGYSGHHRESDGASAAERSRHGHCVAESRRSQAARRPTRRRHRRRHARTREPAPSGLRPPRAGPAARRQPARRGSGPAHAAAAEDVRGRAAALSSAPAYRGGAEARDRACRPRHEIWRHGHPRLRHRDPPRLWIGRSRPRRRAANRVPRGNQGGGAEPGAPARGRPRRRPVAAARRSRSHPALSLLGPDLQQPSHPLRSRLGHGRRRLSGARGARTPDLHAPHRLRARSQSRARLSHVHDPGARPPLRHGALRAPGPAERGRGRRRALGGDPGRDRGHERPGRVRVTRVVPDSLTLFGLLAVTAMLVFYALEDRSRWFILAFAGACVLGSLYGFLQGAWPFGLVEAVWALVAVRRWTTRA